MAEASRLNVLLFLSDDHGAWANGCYGNSEVRTPTLDHLAGNGARFANAFTPTPVCSPARACLLTGRTASQVGIHDWLAEYVDEIGQRDWLKDEKTLFEYFHEADYYTGLCGKWHLGQSHLAPRGADYHLGLLGWQGVHNHEYTYIRNGETFTSSENKSAIITHHALDFLEHVPQDQPFFLNVGYIATHSPYHKSSHDLTLTSIYEQATFVDIPAYESHPWAKNERFDFENPTEQDLRDHYIGYYAAVTEIDNNIARIFEKLKAQDKLKDTIVIYMSDHGCAIGHHGFWGKGNSTRPLNMYEHSLHIPLIWNVPHIAPGQVIQQCVTHYDTFMTLLAMVGITPDADRHYPGKSYLPLLMGEAQAWDDTVYGEYGDLRMIRTPEWKYVQRYPDGPHDLFHLKSDPDETKNVVDQPEYAHIIDELRQRLTDFYNIYAIPEHSGLKVKQLPQHNKHEAWRDGIREQRGLQIY